VVLTKELKRLIRRRHAFVDEVIDSRLPCRHAIIRAVRCMQLALQQQRDVLI